MNDHAELNGAKKSDFDVIQKIGSGASSDVYSVLHKSSKKTFAWKELHYGGMRPQQKRQLVEEVNILGSLQHKNIVRYYCRIIDRSNRCIYLVQEYCEIGDLSAYVRNHSKISEHFVWNVLLQITSALHYCHHFKPEKILHRDLKPQNVFLTKVNGKIEVKLGDFGVSKHVHEDRMTATKVGTPAYQSPEQINGKAYDECSDVWSLGCILYEICCKKPPFNATDHHRSNRKKFKSIIGYSKQLCDIIGLMLSYSPRERPRTNEVLAIPKVSILVQDEEQEKLKKRNELLGIKLEQWRTTNKKQQSLEETLQLRQEKKDLEIKKIEQKLNNKHSQLKDNIDNLLLNEAIRLDFSIDEFNEFKDILSTLSMTMVLREPSRSNSRGRFANHVSFAANTTDGSINSGSAGCTDSSFVWSSSPMSHTGSSTGSTKSTTSGEGDSGAMTDGMTAGLDTPKALTTTKKHQKHQKSEILQNCYIL
eukprot:UN25344